MNETITTSDLFDYNDLPFLKRPIPCSRLLTENELFHLKKHIDTGNPALSLGDKIKYPNGTMRHDYLGLLWVHRFIDKLPPGAASAFDVSYYPIEECIFFLQVTLMLLGKGKLALKSYEDREIKLKSNGKLWFKNWKGEWFDSGLFDLYAEKGNPGKLVLIHSKFGEVPIAKTILGINTRNKKISDLMDITFYLEKDGAKKSYV